MQLTINAMTIATKKYSRRKIINKNDDCFKQTKQTDNTNWDFPFKPSFILKTIILNNFEDEALIEHTNQ